MTSSVIGLDLGSSSAYVAKVENGGVVLLTNEINSRCTPTILSLPSSERGTRYWSGSLFYIKDQGQVLGVIPV